MNEHPELFRGDKNQQLIGNDPDFTDEALEQLGAKPFKGESVSKLVRHKHYPYFLRSDSIDIYFSPYYH